MPAFLRYDQVRSATFPVSAKKSVTLYNQNSLLSTYRGAVGGKIGWTSAAGATYVGMARRNGVTLIVTLLHCPALTEIDAAKSLLDWGFAADGKVRPVGTLVSPLAGPQGAPGSASASGSASAPGSGSASGSGSAPAGAAAEAAAASHPAGSGASALAAAAFSGVALVAAGVGFAYSAHFRRRQRLTPRRRP